MRSSMGSYFQSLADIHTPCSNAKRIQHSQIEDLKKKFLKDQIVDLLGSTTIHPLNPSFLSLPHLAYT